MADRKTSKRGRKGEGRPPHKPTPGLRDLILGLTVNGVALETVCKIVKLDDDTVRKHYAEEVELGRERAGAKVAAYLFNQATGAHGNTSHSVTAAIFYLKTRQGYKESVVLENPDGSGLLSGLDPGRKAKLAAGAAKVLERGAREGS